jgi:hypothetical protein
VSARDGPHPQVVGGLFSCGQRPGVQDVLDHRQPFSPIVLGLVAKHLQDGLYTLIGVFGLSVSLWVIGSAHVVFDGQLVAQLLEHFRGEAHVSVRYQFLWNAGIGKDSFSIEFEEFLCCHGLFAGHQDHCLHTIMVSDG